VTLALTAGILVLDVWTPLGLAVPVLYAAVVFLSFWSPWPRYPVVLAGVSSGLTVVAFFLPPPGAPSWVEITNHALALLMIWTIAGLGLRRRRAESTVHALLRINEKLSSTLQLDALMDGLVREAMSLVGAEAGCSGLRAGQAMVCQRYLRGPAALPLVHSWPPGEGLPGWLIVHRRPYLTNDAATDPQFSRDLWAPFAVRSALAVPISDAGRDVIGFLELHNKSGSGFTASDERSLLGVSRAASIAMQNALAYRKLEQAEVVRGQLLDRIISAQEEERRRIGRELHDEIGQLLTSLLIGLRSAQETPKREAMQARLEELRRDTTRALADVRRLAQGLRPAVLDDLGLDAALNLYAADYARTHAIQADVSVTGLGEARLPRPVEIAIYRITQEALTNTARHAAAKAVSIIVQRSPSEVRLVVEDDGCGFDASAVPHSSPGRLGLHGMRERAALLGGSLSIESSPGKGSAICVAIPLRSAP
jgi:signal transduction histidine kinase